MVDKTVVLDRFDGILNSEFQQGMRDRNMIFIPNRAFTSYCGIDRIENEFRVPMFGTRSMLRMEERTEEFDYYWLLEKAGLPYPEAIEDPQDIDCLVIVKLHHAQKNSNVAFSYVHPTKNTLRSRENSSLKASLMRRVSKPLESSGMLSAQFSI